MWFKKNWEKREGGKKKKKRSEMKIDLLGSKNKSLGFEKMQVYLPCSPLVILILH